VVFFVRATETGLTIPPGAVDVQPEEHDSSRRDEVVVNRRGEGERIGESRREGD
jgi:hypothetical protein